VALWQPGVARAILFAMRRGVGVAVGFLVMALSGFGVHLALNYAWIQADLRKREAVEVRPIGDDRAFVDDGVVVTLRREMHVRDRRQELAWVVAVPATGRMYTCDYEEGFGDFAKGDVVTFIHKPAETDEPEGASFLIDENRARQGKAARVTPVELIGADNPDAAP
jgi:hypothetical protein